MKRARKIWLVTVLVTLLSYALPAMAEDQFAGRPSHGPDNAPVQILEFSDFQCAHCAKNAPVLHAVLMEYGDLVELIVMNITTPGHAYSEPAAELALTAWEQGKYWEAYLALFANQDLFSDDYFGKLAVELGVDAAVVQDNIANHKHRELLKKNFMTAISELELEVTPTLFINGQKIEGAKSPDYLRYYINKALEKKGIESPVGPVPEPPEKTSAQTNRVPLDMIFPVAKMKAQNSTLNVKVGDKAPDFELPTILAGIGVKLSSYRGDKNVVLSFVPAAWTPQCSAQWPEYNEYENEFAELDAVVIGISADNVPSLYSWTVSMGRPWFVVASDFWPHGAVAQTYGVFRPEGVTERAIFIVDKKGVIRYIDVHDINGRPGIKTLIEELKKIQAK